MSRLISQFFGNLNSSKNFTCPSGKLRTEFSSPTAKSTSPGLSDSTFFAHWSETVNPSLNLYLDRNDDSVWLGETGNYTTNLYLDKWWPLLVIWWIICLCGYFAFSINLANAKQKQRIHSCIKIKSMFRTTVMSVFTCQVLDKCGLSFVSRFRIKLRWNLYLVDTFGTFPTVRLIEGVCSTEVVKIAQCLLTINIQWLLCTVIKLHVVKEAIQSSSSLPFITNFNLFVNAKTSTDFSAYSISRT